MLRKRLIASACFITPVLLLLWLDANWNFGMPGFWVVLTTASVSLVIAAEFQAMTALKTAGTNRFAVFAGVLGCHLVTILPDIDGFPQHLWTRASLVLLLVYLVAAFFEVFRYGKLPQPVERLALTLFAVFYCGWLLSFLAALRVQVGDPHGVFAMFSVLWIIKMSDAGAYFVGKRFGKNKLAPQLSPGKTWEGLFGGLVAGGFAAWIAFSVFRSWLFSSQPAVAPSNWALLAYAVSIILMGVVGDLAESLIKREMNVKDSSGWLPGLGGIMDTADSVIVASPIAYAWWASGLIS